MYLKQIELAAIQNRNLLVALAKVVLAQNYLVAPDTPLGRALRELDIALVEAEPRDRKN